MKWRRQFTAKQLAIFYQPHAFDLSDWRLKVDLHDFPTSIGANRRRHRRKIWFGYNYHPDTGAATFRLLQSVENPNSLTIVGMGWCIMVERSLAI